jgi:hypothetical protein
MYSDNSLPQGKISVWFCGISSSFSIILIALVRRLIMEHTTEPEPVRMDNLTEILRLLGAEICQQVEQKTQVSQDQVKSGFIQTLEELSALKAELKITKAMLEGFATLQDKTAPKDEADFVHIQVR